MYQLVLTLLFLFLGTQRVSRKAAAFVCTLKVPFCPANGKPEDGKSNEGEPPTCQVGDQGVPEPGVSMGTYIQMGLVQQHHESKHTIASSGRRAGPAAGEGFRQRKRFKAAAGAGGSNCDLQDHEAIFLDGSE